MKFNEINFYDSKVCEYVHNLQKEKYKIIEMKLVPQRFLKFLPFAMLNIMRRFLGNVIVEIRVKAKVVK